MDHILYQIFKIIFEYIWEKYNEKIDNPSIRIYQNKIESTVTFKIKTRYYLELLTPETTKLLGSTENRTTKDKNDENAPHFKITEVVLVQCNTVNNDYQQDSTVLYIFVPNKSFGSLLKISQKKVTFEKHLNQSFKQLKYGFQIKTVNH